MCVYLSHSLFLSLIESWKIALLISLRQKKFEHCVVPEALYSMLLTLLSRSNDSLKSSTVLGLSIHTIFFFFQCNHECKLSHGNIRTIEVAHYSPYRGISAIENVDDGLMFKHVISTFIKYGGLAFLQSCSTTTFCITKKNVAILPILSLESRLYAKCIFAYFNAMNK